MTLCYIGYSDGNVRANADGIFTSGGQCEDGLRMIIVIIGEPISSGNWPTQLGC